ncbi:MAG: transposase [Candidatus Omnitrophota bacterium]
MVDFEGKKSVFFVRKKIIPANTIVHIIQRAPGKEMLFLEKGDYYYLMKLLKETSSKFNMEVFCFSLMPNHFHLLVRFLEDNASLAIKNLCERYAWFLNLKYKRKGHVFYGAYRASICLDDTYLLASSLYIHMNSVKARLALDPFEYQWSSAPFYAENFEAKTFIKYQFILEVIDENIEKARKIYRKLLKESLRIKTGNAIEDYKVLRILRRKLLLSFSKLDNIAKGNKNALDSVLLEKKITEYTELRKFRNPQSRKAKAYLIQQLRSNGYNTEDIAELLSISKRAIYKILSQLKFTK